MEFYNGLLTVMGIVAVIGIATLALGSLALVISEWVINLFTRR